MKKINFLYAIILFVVFTLVSCKDDLLYLDNENTNTEKSNDGNFEYTDSDDNPVEYNVSDGSRLQFNDGYLYFYNGMSDYFNGSSNTLMRYNVKTGNITTVCPDPLCGHNTSDCPFFGLQNTFYVKNNKVSFNRTYMTEKTEPNGIAPIFWHGFVTYNMKNSKFTVHRTFNDFSETGGYIYQLYVDNYRYYHDMNVYDEKTDSYSSLLSRMDLDTSKIVRLNENNVFDEEQLYTVPFSERFLFALDGRIYMTDIKTIYSTNYEYKDKKIHATGDFAFHVKTDGKYIYYGVQADVESTYRIQNIHRMNFDGTDDIDLGIVAEDFTLTEKYIYYITPDEISIGKNRGRAYSGSEIVLFGSEIRRSDQDGTNNESVFKFEGDMANYRFEGSVPCYVGNYIYGIYGYWMDSNGDGVFEDGDYYSSSNNEDFNIMRINIATGEIYYIRIK